MLTLVLVVGLCAEIGCIYDDVTAKFKITSDRECAQIANFANSENKRNHKEPRFACLEPSEYQNLAAREI